ncbi:MAG: hypothetical protein GY947_17385 [Rhodobacteraceae bacterium]|nr:hypothetical protein [Paracoccaceae bacterium]
MKMLTAQKTAQTTFSPKHREFSSAPFWLRVLNWLASREDRFRQEHKLRNLPDERLDDMGMTRQDVKTAFRRR